MRLDIPVSVHITGLVFLHTSGLNLLETPLRQVDISCAQVAAQHRVSQSECRRQGTNLGTVARSRITDYFHLPVVLVIANSDVSVARDLPVGFGDRSSNGVRVEVATG